MTTCVRPADKAWNPVPALVFLLALLCASSLGAQSIDEEAGRFLSSPHGRTGCYSPYRLVMNTEGADTITVQSLAPGVVLEHEVAAGGRDRVEVVIPVFVGDGARVRVGSRTIKPAAPIRRVAPDYARPYTAVFSPDPVGARAVLPSARESMVCDYYEIGDFFTDWRLLDAYDALVIFNPGDVRLPPGSQRAIAEFCSLGGAVFIAGSFRFGEQAVDLPAPVGPEIMSFRDTPVQRFAYGPGAIYRATWGDLTGSRSARLVVAGALQDHMWFGGGDAPGGEPASRARPTRAPLAPPQPPLEARPGVLFFGLAGGLLLLCALVPAVAARLTKQRWAAHLCVLAGASGIGAAALLQERPLPVVEVACIYRTGEGGISSAIEFQMSEKIAGEVLVVDLERDRRLPKALPARTDWSAWMIFTPLKGDAGRRGPDSRLAYARVGEDSFRDFSTRAHRGNTQFSDSDAWLVEWWLEHNAYRGRFATLAPAEWRPHDDRSDDVRVVKRGAIRVTDLREQR